MYLENTVELYGVLQPHSNINCAQPARYVDTDDADGLTGFASFLFPPKMTQPSFVPYIPWVLTEVISQLCVLGVH